MRLIMAATDGSVGADRAVDAGAELAKSTGAHLLILTVLDHLPAHTAKAFAAAEHVTEAEVAEIASRGTLVRAQERAASHGVDAHVLLERGDPSDVILRIAELRGVDAIVVGKRDCGQLRGLLLGSLSQKLASLAPCAVVIVP